MRKDRRWEMFGGRVDDGEKGEQGSSRKRGMKGRGWEKGEEGSKMGKKREESRRWENGRMGRGWENAEEGSNVGKGEKESMVGKSIGRVEGGTRRGGPRVGKGGEMVEVGKGEEG